MNHQYLFMGILMNVLIKIEDHSSMTGRLDFGNFDFSCEGVDISEQIIRIEMEVKRQADEALRPGMEVNSGGEPCLKISQKSMQIK